VQFGRRTEASAQARLLRPDNPDWDVRIGIDKSAYGEVFPEGVILFRLTLEELSARDRGCRLGRSVVAAWLARPKLAWP